MTDGEATQSSEETVGPLQFGGHDEPGPDYNRRAPEPGQEAPEPRDTTERLPSEAPIISGQLAREIQDGKDNARAVNEGINDGRLTSMRPPWLREVASLDSATTYSDESDGPSGENDSTQESDSERYVRLKNKLESLDRQMDELDFGHAGRQPLAAEIEKIKAELEPLERKLLPRDRDMAEAESETGGRLDQENGGAVGTSFTDRFTDQEPSAGEPDGPTGDVRPSPEAERYDAETQQRLRYYNTRINEARDKGDEAEVKEFEGWIERLKHWADVCNRQPVGPEYEEDHPGIEFTAAGLFKIERYMIQDLHHVKLWSEERPEQYEASAGENQKGMRELLEELEGAAEDDPVIREELEQKEKDDSFSFADAKEIYRRYCQQEVAKAQASADRYRQILADVESGRASDPDYQKPQEGSETSV